MRAQASELAGGACEPDARASASRCSCLPTPLHVAFVTSEMAPYMKTGGLADVSAALPKALGRLGHRVTVFLPRYGRSRFRRASSRARSTCRWTRCPAAPASTARTADGRRGRLRRAPAVLRPRPRSTATTSDNRLRFAFLSRAAPRVLPQPRRAARRLPRPRLADGPRARLPEGVLLGRPRRCTGRPASSRSTTWRTRATSARTRSGLLGLPWNLGTPERARVPRRRQLHEGRHRCSPSS